MIIKLYIPLTHLYFESESRLTWNLEPLVQEYRHTPLHTVQYCSDGSCGGSTLTLAFCQ